MARQDPDSETRRRDLLSGRSSHHEEHAGLRPVVQRGRSPAREEGQVRSSSVSIQNQNPSCDCWCLCRSGPVARVLLFNATGERDSAVMLKLLQVRTSRYHSCSCLVLVVPNRLSARFLSRSILTSPSSVPTSPNPSPPAMQVRSRSGHHSRVQTELIWWFWSSLRPAELQRVCGEHADPLPGQREELASPQQAVRQRGGGGAAHRPAAGS